MLRPAPTSPAHLTPPVTPHLLADLAVAACTARARLPLIPDVPAPQDPDGTAALRAVEAVRPTFAAVAEAADGRPLDRALRTELGRLGEAAALDGAAVHRGELWSVGLLVAGAAATGCRSAYTACAAAATLARLPYDGAPGPADTPGGRARLHFHVPGATGQAASGFPHVRRVALPALRESRAHGRPEIAARMDALLTLMATLDDTSLLHEGGPAALLSVQMDAREVVRAGGYDSPGGRAALDRLDARMRDPLLVPRGSRAVLSAALFLDFTFGTEGAAPGM
ncbi:triphosphoribosyl-dephospho-CoA synthase MdcB [Streptomyces sp. Ru73]|uniref:triphosphoribosyl-dephospho-CoA synthase n=1 Tax=Streptomyces sp. Ru73 TaxID=2080748 RepID=UPI000CDCF704|nr:triphosphoribosyl-dephospho-CoA synthase [Streptomyces sp. Ru73]POX40079.1 triphosphoribosyl-dephospho-CoA synthase MdcB [Streptomyces sp. Ru73]